MLFLFLHYFFFFSLSTDMTAQRCIVNEKQEYRDFVSVYFSDPDGILWCFINANENWTLHGIRVMNILTRVTGY